MQCRLLRVLQERVIEPLGAVESIPVDVRVIAATHQNLAQRVKEGKFREDLYYRVNVVRLELPPLRDRREDIPLLVEHLIGKFNRLQAKEVVGLSDEALAGLMEHDYPGNVRELENILEHAFVLCRRGLIEVRHLPTHIQNLAGSTEARVTLPTTLAGMERLMISDALRRNGGNRTVAARELGIAPSTLFRKIRSSKLATPEDPTT